MQVDRTSVTYACFNFYNKDVDHYYSGQRVVRYLSEGISEKNIYRKLCSPQQLEQGKAFFLTSELRFSKTVEPLTKAWHTGIFRGVILRTQSWTLGRVEEEEGKSMPSKPSPLVDN